MRVLTFASQKGGAGKSTLCRAFSVIAGEAGEVFVIDRDPQMTTARWCERRAGLDPKPAQPRLVDDLEGATIAQAAGQLRKARAGTLLIDTPGRVGEVVGEAIEAADVVIVPVRPSPDDVEAAEDTLALVRRLGKPALIIINAAPNERRAVDARAALSQWPVPVCPFTLMHRTILQDAALLGAGVSEMQGAAARTTDAELRRIWAWIDEKGEAAR